MVDSQGDEGVIDCLCVVCHRPIPRKESTDKMQGRTWRPTFQGLTAITCQDDGGQCRSRWYQSIVKGKGLAPKYRDMRILHAWRREQEAALAHMRALCGRLGIEVSEEEIAA